MSDLIIRYRISGVVTETSVSDENIRIERTQEGNRHRVTVTANKQMRLYEASIRMERRFRREDLIFANGYQSWTESREFLRSEHLNDLSRLPSVIEDRYHFKAYGSQAFWPMERDWHLGFDYSYIRGSDPLFIGSLNYRHAYLLIQFCEEENAIVLHSDVSHRMLQPGESFPVFDYVLEEDGTDYYARFTPRTGRKLLGYTSWYNHFRDIDREKILRVLDDVDPRFELFQIDDGFETHVGDWLDVDPAKFPDGLKPVVDRIHEKGMMAGIWLSPLIAENDSALMRDHPDWIARDKGGDIFYAGCNWSGFAALDINRSEVVDYIRQVLRHYVSLGFDFFKLDFLYAVNLRRLHGKTHAETAEYAYGLIREELEGKTVLACGATLSNVFERFEYCRIGPDVSLRFDDVPYMRIFHPERISTKVTLQNTIYRSPLNGRMFSNDPDVFLLRSSNTRLSRSQRESLTKINALFGSLLMTSDDIAAYGKAEQAVLEQALQLFYEGKVLDFERQGKEILIRYELGGEIRRMIYHCSRGTLKEE